MVDNEKRPAMGYIYEAMDRAKEAIQKAFNGNEEKYKDILMIIDKRWDCQLHHPLHAAGYYLNPEFFYSNPNIDNDGEVMEGLFKCIDKLSQDEEFADKVHSEILTYKRAGGLFGNPTAIRKRTTMAPADWWKMYGAKTPHLQLIAIKILSLTCSSSGCERNWSTFEHIHSKKRNRLEHQKLQDLVYVKYNQALHERYVCEDARDPIALGDIDEGNEWMLGEEEDDEEDFDELVFDDDILTWRDVGNASGAAEPLQYTRRQTQKKKAADASTSSRKGKGKEVVVEEENEDEDEDEDEEGEEEEVDDELDNEEYDEELDVEDDE